jgi:hypothetical protein
MFATQKSNESKTPAGGKSTAGAAHAKNDAPRFNSAWQSLALRSVGIQAKLAVSPPSDSLEQEADACADRVMRMTTPPADGPQSVASQLSYSSVASSDKVQRKCAPCAEEEERLQRKSEGDSADSSATAPPIVLEALSSPGQPLDSSVRSFMEPRFGQDFSHVRIHSDGRAAASARAVDALAYTVGRDIVFDTARHNPSTAAGRQILAHELTHVVQQGQGTTAGPAVVGASSSVAPLIAPEHSAAELEADEVAHRVLVDNSRVSGARATPAGTIHRTVRIEPADAALTLFLDALTRLTGRAATAAGGMLALGASVPGARPSGTISDYIQRAVSASRGYILRSGATTPGGLPVRGVRSEVASSGVVITVNTADAGTHTWTADELVSEGFVNAVSANDRTTQTFPATTAAGAPPGTNVDDLLATTLPFATAALRLTAMNLIRQRAPAVATDAYLEADVDTILQGGRGVTLAEILRGLETNTPFRIVQEMDGDRVYATYYDPRRRPAAGESQRLPQRNVTFLAGPGRASPAAAPVRQQSGVPPAQVAQANASCTPAVLGEIRIHITRAQSLITRAMARLASQENLDAPLTAHFGGAGPASRARINRNFQVILSEMDFSRHAWVCTLHGSGQGCNDPRVTGFSGISNSPVNLCIAPSAPFLPRATTVLHEVVHTCGIGTLGAGVEKYFGRDLDYPGNDPLHNADSYAQFAALIGTGPVQAPAPSGPPPSAAPQVAPPSPAAPQAAPPPAGQRAPMLQRAPNRGTERLHQGIAEQYRRSHGLPAGGVNEFGQRAGPSDAEIVYGGLSFPVPLSELATMSAWQLAQVNPERLVPASGATPPVSGPTYADYARARVVVRYLHAFFGLTYDYEIDQRVVGRAPNPQELQTLNNNLSQLLSTYNVRGLVTGHGGRGLPTAAGGATASLEGRVSIVSSRGDFGGKYFQLQRLIGADRMLGHSAAYLQSQATTQWAIPATGVTAAGNALLTNPEKVALAWSNLAAGTNSIPAFFFPPEDRFYLGPHIDLNTLEGQDVARHETVHLLGGRERTRQAFITRFGARWLNYWSSFEEGMAEFVNISSRTTAQTPPSATGQSPLGSAYGQFYDHVRELIADPAVGRDAVLRAYFTGSISEDIFRRWQVIVERRH